jgi:hypothetical protein
MKLPSTNRALKFVKQRDRSKKSNTSFFLIFVCGFEFNNIVFCFFHYLSLEKQWFRTRDCRTTVWHATIEPPCLPLSLLCKNIGDYKSKYDPSLRPTRQSLTPQCEKHCRVRFLSLVDTTKSDASVWPPSHKSAH